MSIVELSGKSYAGLGGILLTLGALRGRILAFFQPPVLPKDRSFGQQ